MFSDRKRALTIVLAAAFGLLGLGVLAQVTEGMDPMRVVYLQQAHPTMVLLLDKSGSMSFPVQLISPQSDGNSDFDDDGTNTYYNWKWYLSKNSSSVGGGNFTTRARYTNGPAGYTNYDMWRMYGDYTVSATYKSGNGLWIKAAVWTGSSSKKLPIGMTINPAGSTYNTNNSTITVWYFLPPSRAAILKNVMGSDVVYYNANAIQGGTDGWNKPYYLFVGTNTPVGASEYYLDATGASQTVLGSIWYSNFSNYTLTVQPHAIVETSKTFVNWGLQLFSGSPSPTDTGSPGTAIAPVSNDDSTTQTAQFALIRPYLKLVADGGYRPYGGTPLRAGIYRSKLLLQTALTGDTSECFRTYGVIAVTDGQSNTGNYNDSNWTGCPTTSTSCGCLGTQKYPPYDANQAWANGIVKGTDTYHVRTYCIGVSEDVSKCELNWTAYYGRTDAYANDVGFNTCNDARLPSGYAGTVPCAGHLYDYGGVNGTPAHNYAFFANTAEAINDGLHKILSTMGAGDYTTSPPATAMSLQQDGAPYAILGSTEFSSLKGHLYAYDVSVPTDPVLIWDAGANLSCPYLDAADNPTSDVALRACDNPAFTTADQRAIYTWNPTTGVLIPIPAAPTLAQAQQIDTLAGFASATFAKTATVNGATIYPIIDFVRGKVWDPNAGMYLERPWKLGPILNNTPAIITHAVTFEPQDTANIPPHADFFSTYSVRHPLVYIGSSDGMVHAFDFADGKEIYALLPPNNLSNQPALFYNRVNGGTGTGEPTDYAKHIYGVGNSPRYGDLAFCTGNGSNRVCGYKTVLFITEGPGGNDPTKNAAPAGPVWPAWLNWAAWAWPNSTAPRSGLYTVDVTHPYPGRTAVSYQCPGPGVIPEDYPADPNYDPVHQVVPLGYVDSSSGVGLNQTWSVPSMGSYAAGSWGCLIGSGVDPASKVVPAPVNQVAPKALVFDPTSYSTGQMNLIRSTTLTMPATGKIVGDQAFSDGAVWNEDDYWFNMGQLMTQGVLTDLAGQIWFLPSVSGSGTVGISVGAGEPLYYSPAMGYMKSDYNYQVYAFGSGSFYENAPAVTGSGLCTGTNFCGKIFLAVHKEDTPATPLPITYGGTNTSAIWGKKMTEIPISTAGPQTLSDRAQVTSSPLLITPSQSSTVPTASAVYLIYDAGSGSCAGDSYVLRVGFDPADLAGTGVSGSNIFHASEGVAGGMVITSSGNVMVSISGVGEGSRATVVDTGLKLGTGASNMTPLWWIEVK